MRQEHLGGRRAALASNSRSISYNTKQFNALVARLPAPRSTNLRFSLFFSSHSDPNMGTISRPGGMRPKWHKKRIKRLKLRRRKMRQRSK
jgi:hypothetical protein